jgi:hypothetical protein
MALIILSILAVWQSPSALAAMARVDVDAVNVNTMEWSKTAPLCFRAPLAESDDWESQKIWRQSCAKVAKERGLFLDGKDCLLVTTEWQSEKTGKREYDKTLRLRIYNEEDEVLLHEILATTSSSQPDIKVATAIATCQAAFRDFGQPRSEVTYKVSTALDSGPFSWLKRRSVFPRGSAGTEVGGVRDFFVEGGPNVGGMIGSVALSVLTGAFGGMYLWNAGGRFSLGYYLTTDHNTALLASTHYAIYGDGSYTEHSKMRYSAYSLGVRHYLLSSDYYLDAGLANTYAHFTHSGSPYHPYGDEDDYEDDESFHRCEKASAVGLTAGLGFDMGNGRNQHIGTRFELLTAFMPFAQTSKTRNCDATREAEDFTPRLRESQLIGLLQIIFVFTP